MVAKTDKNSLGIITAKALYTLLKESLNDNAIYVGVSYIPDSEYNIYSSSLDSESTFYGGVDSDYDSLDKTFYNQSMYSMHKALAGGISRVVKRSDWTYGNVYENYPAEKSYVISKNYEAGYANLNVYVCLFSPKTVSTVMPTGSSFLPVTYSDGYVWKYLYTISNSQSIRFLNDTWMPVPERIPTSDFANITTDSPNYSQYANQINATPGSVYGITFDSDALINDINNDSDLRVAFNFNTVELIGRDIASNTPSKTFRFNLKWDLQKKSFYTSLVSPGEGYVGPLTIGLDSDSTSITSIVPVVAPGYGHGSNIPNEMNVKNIMITVRNIPDPDDVMYNGTKYNLISLQVDPVDNTTGRIADKQNYITCNYFELESTNTYKINDIVRSKFNSKPPAIVIAVKDQYVYYTIPSKGGAYNSFKDSEIIELEIGGKENTIKKHYDRNIVFNSGNILVADYRDSTVDRSLDQIETFNFVLEF